MMKKAHTIKTYFVYVWCVCLIILQIKITDLNRYTALVCNVTKVDNRNNRLTNIYNILNNHNKICINNNMQI